MKHATRHTPFSRQVLTTTATAFALGAATAPSFAQQPGAPAAPQPAPMAATMGNEMVAAEVTKADKASSRVTLTHGEVKSLAIPASTMTYHVKDPAMFDLLAEGAKVRVTLARSPLGLMVVQVEQMG